MTDDRFSLGLPGLMNELARGDEGYIDDVLVKVAATRQRPAWTFVSHWLPAPAVVESLPAYRNRLIIAFLLVGLLALLLASAAFFGSRRVQALPILDASNGWIAVSANPAAKPANFGQIYLLSAGNPARRIIGSDGDGLADACPRFSPDGQLLAYGEADNVSAATNERGLWPVAHRAVVVVGINDHGDASPPIVRVVLPAYPGEIPCPEWSPDGTKIAFRVGAELWVTDAKSGNTQVLQAEAAPWGQSELEWSRDGSRIAVTDTGHIRVVPVDGSGPTFIAAGSNTPASLSWLAGDDRIVYIRTDQPGDGQSVDVVDADGHNDTSLATGTSGSASKVDYANSVVSPDGARIAYDLTPYDCTADSCTTEPDRLLIMDPDGSNVVEVPIPPDLGVGGLQWSPDGKRLLVGWIGAVYSVAATPGSPPIFHSNGDLDLEWTTSELTWQPVRP